MIKNLPQRWRVEKLDDIVFFQEGPGVRNTQFRNQGVKLLNVGNINDNKINLDATKIYISEEEAYGKYSHFLVDDGDLLIACSGIVVENFHKKISFISKKDLPLCLNTSTMRFKTLNEKILNINFYKYFLMSDIFKHQLQKLITGSAQLNFGPSHIKKMFAPLPPLPQQEKIVKVLDKSASLIEQQKQLIEKYDVFLKSKFIEMFGTLKDNIYCFDVEPISKFGKIITGNTPPRDNPDYYNENFIEWIKTDNILENKQYVSTAKEYLSELGAKKGRTLEKDGLLITCIAGSLRSIGNVALTDRKISFNQQINAIQPFKNINSLFLYWLIKLNISYIQSFATSSMKKIITKGEFENIKFIKPPLDLQNKFSFLATKIQAIKEKETQKLNHLKTLHLSLMDKAFKGEII